MIREPRYGPFQNILGFVHPFHIFFSVRWVSLAFKKGSEFHLKNKKFNLTDGDIKSLEKSEIRSEELLRICYDIVKERQVRESSMQSLLRMNLSSRYYANFLKICQSEVTSNPEPYHECTKSLLTHYFCEEKIKEDFSYLLLCLFGETASLNKNHVVGECLSQLVFSVLNSPVLSEGEVKSRVWTIVDFIKQRGLPTNITILWIPSEHFCRSKERVHFYLSYISSDLSRDAEVISMAPSTELEKLEILECMKKKQLERLMLFRRTTEKNVKFIAAHTHFSERFKERFRKKHAKNILLL